MKTAMSPKERLLATLNRQPVDRIPIAQPLQTGTLELMKSCGAFWPAAHRDAHKMAVLAYEAHKAAGFESVRVPFDINVESEAMGCELNYGAGRNKGLDIQPPVKTAAMDQAGDFSRLKDADPYRDGRMPVVLEAIGQLRKNIPDTLPIISLVVGPFMVAAQVRGVENFMRELIRKPENCKELLDQATRICRKFAFAQAAAGSDCILVADASASPDLISPRIFERYAKPYSRDMMAGLPIPSILHICGKAQTILPEMAEISPGVSIDSCVDMAEARSVVGGKTALCGNVDVRTLLFGRPEDVEKAVKDCMDQGTDLLTTSCGIPPAVRTENLRAMVAAGKRFGESASLHP